MYWEEVNRTIWESRRVYTFLKSEAPVTKPIIYFDMDGVLANWNWEKSEEHPDGVTMEEVFTPGYFRNLKPIDEYVQFAKDCKSKGIDVKILSKSIYTAINEKWEWLQEYMPFINKEDIYFVPLDENKNDYIQTDNPYAILIDDYNPNLYNWQGISIKAITEKNTINPNFNWIEKDMPIFKKSEVLIYELLKAVKEELSITGKEYLKDIKSDRLLQIYHMNLISKDEFINLCNNFEISIKDINVDDINWQCLADAPDFDLD